VRSLRVSLPPFLGVDAILEPKHPVASSAIVGQLLRYREDLRRKTASQHVQCLAVAPRIPDRVVKSLTENGMESREVPPPPTLYAA